MSPPDVVQGQFVRMLYIHPAVATMCYAGFGVCALGSVAWLWPRLRSPRWDLSLIHILLTRVDPLTYAVDPLRKAVFEHLHKVPKSVVERLVPGVTWDGWHVPVGLELGVVAMMAMLFITIAALEFRKVD